MTPTILQLIINGHINNYNELLTVLKFNKPYNLSLQETHITLTQQFPTPVYFEMYHFTSVDAKGGVALLVHKSDILKIQSKQQKQTTFSSLICTYHWKF